MADQNQKYEKIDDQIQQSSEPMESQRDYMPMLQVIRGNKRYAFTCASSETLLQAMLRNNVYLSAYCKGRGTCGKCKVKLLEGSLEITACDRMKFSEEELREGYRLSCFAYPKQNCKVLLEAMDEENFNVVVSNSQASPKDMLTEESYGIAIDIGTTTLAISLVGRTSNRIFHTHARVNKQRSYGADVLSRIQTANEGNLELLQRIIQGELLEGIKELVLQTSVDKSKIQAIAIAGNTTMGHLFLGYSCEGLGVFPFTPVDINTTTKSFLECFQSDFLEATVTLLPGISAFIGADIVAGLSVCDFDRGTGVKLMVDLGTNGEMAIGNQDKIFVTSTAAGPAFEGGNIEFGIGSVAGAICSVTIENEMVRYETIQDQPPIGICGTGVIEIISELLKAKLIDDTGLLTEEYFEHGFVLGTEAGDGGKEQHRLVLTQKDIREFQFAKAAIRAGIEVLMERYGVAYDQIDRVYLAGGFGYHMDIKKAVHIGLLPGELEDKIHAVGNSSLAGAESILLEDNRIERMERIISVSREIHLANEESFNESYMKYMYF